MQVRSVLPIRTAKLGNITAALLGCLLGLFLIADPDRSTAAIGTVAGIFLIVSGGLRIAGYFSKDLYRLAFQFDLPLGILLVLLGTVLLFRPENLLHFLCIAAGIYVTADGMFRLQTAVEAKRFGISHWWAIFAAAIVTGIFGIVLLINPASSVRMLTQLLGIAVLAESVMNLITLLLTVKIVHNQKPDIIDTQGYETKGES